jgi:DNA-binding XRE family transcriptional regulator
MSTVKQKNHGNYMIKFYQWIKNNDKKQSAVALKLGISPSSLHDILKQNQMPSLKIAYEIEQYTRGEVTVYDWIDQEPEKKIEKKIKK